MMNNKVLMLLLICSLSAGCASLSTKMNRISLGMTKAEVIQVLGQPTRITVEDNREVLDYIGSPGFSGQLNQYWVFIDYGRVSKYGPSESFVSPQERMAKQQADAINRQAAAQGLMAFSNQLQQAQYQQQQLDLQRQQTAVSMLGSSSKKSQNCTTRFVGNTAYTDCY